MPSKIPIYINLDSKGIVNKIKINLKKGIEKTLIGAMRQNSDGFVQRIISIANTTSYRNRSYFIPTDRQAYELGIQSKIGVNEIDEEKRSGAWRVLQTDEPGSAAVISHEKGTGENIVTIRFGWDKEKFYNHERSIVKVFNMRRAQGEGSLSYSWMKTFIEGRTVSGYDFWPGKGLKESRTGGGIMKKGGSWTFSPNPFDISALTVVLADEIKFELRLMLSRGAIEKLLTGKSKLGNAITQASN